MSDPFDTVRKRSMLDSVFMRDALQETADGAVPEREGWWYVIHQDEFDEMKWLAAERKYAEAKEGEVKLLVCPNCGSDRTGTIEEARIWQPATFTLLAPGDEGKMGSGHEDAQGRGVDVEWDAYDSDDVGDTETVGFFCKACLATWEGRDVVPFVVPEEVTA